MTNNDTFAIARKYHTLGRCVIPTGGIDMMLRWSFGENTANKGRTNNADLFDFQTLAVALGQTIKELFRGNHLKSH